MSVPQTWSCIAIIAYQGCVPQFIFHRLKEIPACSCSAGGGVHVRIDENQGFVSLVWFFYSDAMRFAWACGPLIQVKWGYCLAEIARNSYCHTTALMPLNDCEVLKHQWSIWACPCFLQAYYIKVVVSFTFIAKETAVFSSNSQHEMRGISVCIVW